MELDLAQLPTFEATKTGYGEPNDPFAVSDDDSEDVFQTIDEVSKNIFGSTRRLPPGKPLRDSHDEDHEELEVTNESSARRVTRSMTTPKGSQKDKEIPAPSNVSSPLICNAAYVPYAEDGLSAEQVESASKCTDDVSDSTSENIDVAPHGPADANVEQATSSSSLSELSRSPSPPAGLVAVKTEIQQDQGNEALAADESAAVVAETKPLTKKRKMTGRTSKHFTPDKRKTRNQPSEQTTNDIAGEPIADPIDPIQPQESTNTDPSPQSETPRISQSTRSSTRKQRKGTGKRSTYFTPPKPPLDLTYIDRVDLYNTTAGSKPHRLPAGTSTAPVPSIHSASFGIIQEKLWREPFWLLIAVTFLNKTTGRAAAPVFWLLKERYGTPEALAEARHEELEALVWHLGLQRQRSRRLIAIASAWVQRPPVRGVRFRTLHYPRKGDGKEFKGEEVVEGDVEACDGALEIGQIPGCGPYAWDSWRIFCRDVLRGVAGDYNGGGGAVVRKEREEEGEPEFVPEWQKVLPLDKELRACLRWMWLREGWIWDPETGEKRRATVDEMEKAERGEMEIEDSQERKFAAQAAGVEIEQDENETPVKTASVDDSLADAVEAELKDMAPKVDEKRAVTPEPVAEDESDLSDNIVVSPIRKGNRRSARLSV